LELSHSRLRPYRAKTKGKIERPIRYLRSNCLYGRAFVGDADLDDQRERWLDEVANVRIHRTIKEAPRAAMRCLAPHVYGDDRVHMYVQGDAANAFQAALRDELFAENSS
jgi:hypothetical protein